jgi:hypothetical protein
MTARGARASRVSLSIESLEDRLTPASPVIYDTDADGSLLVRVASGSVQVVDLGTGSILSSRSLDEVSLVQIGGNGHALNLTVDESARMIAGGVTFLGGSGLNRLEGPAGDRTWQVTGPGEGWIDGPGFVRFSGVENLLGAADNRDVRLAAIRALSKCRQPESVVALAKVLAAESGKDTAMVGRAHDGLVRLTGKRLPPDPKEWNAVVQAGVVIAPEPSWIEDAVQTAVGWVKP